MTPEERKEKLDALSSRLFVISQEIESLIPELSSDVDHKAARSIVTDLHWAVENCTVIGLHQIGKALDDTMGY
jgi:hypothetical protein